MMQNPVQQHLLLILTWFCVCVEAVQSTEGFWIFILFCFSAAADKQEEVKPNCSSVKTPQLVNRQTGSVEVPDLWNLQTGWTLNTSSELNWVRFSSSEPTYILFYAAERRFSALWFCTLTVQPVTIKSLLTLSCIGDTWSSSVPQGEVSPVGTLLTAISAWPLPCGPFILTNSMLLYL